MRWPKGHSGFCMRSAENTRTNFLANPVLRPARLETRAPKARPVKCFSPSRVQKQHSVLMSVIAGEAVAAVRSLEDKQVLQQCMATLRELFKEQVRHTPFEKRKTHLPLTSCALQSGVGPKKSVPTEYEGAQGNGPQSSSLF